MKRFNLLLLIASLLAGSVRPAGASPGTGLQIVVHADNPVLEIDREEVAAFYLLEGQSWADGVAVEPVAQAPGSPVESAFRFAFHQSSAAAVRHVWERVEAIGRRLPPTAVEGDSAVLDWVSRRPGGIGYVSAAAIPASGVKVLPVTDREQTETYATREAPRRVSLVVDASGSMARAIDGRRKIDIARATLHDLLAEWDSELQSGLTAFGHLGSGCVDVETLMPLGPHRPEQIEAALKRLRAKGGTPLTQAIRHAGIELAGQGEEESRMVVVSDGHETCGGDPCSLVGELEERGVKVTAYVVGFDILRDRQAQAELRCLAQRSGGTFELAWDARSLEKALGRAVDRAAGRKSPEDPATPRVDVAEREQETEPIVDPGLSMDLDFRLIYVGRPFSEESKLKVDFWITDTEITQGDWRLVMDGDPSYFGGCDACPVERVSWIDAVAFANRLSQRTGFESCYDLEDCKGTPGSGCEAGERECDGDFRCSHVYARGPACPGFRLPAVDEWDLAAPAGDANCVAASAGGEGGGPKEVRVRAANSLGIYDVHGNVWEWVAETASREQAWQQRQIFSGDTVPGPHRPTVRGGSFAEAPDPCRAAPVGKRKHTDRYHDVGFRLVRTAGDDESPMP